MQACLPAALDYWNSLSTYLLTTYVQNIEVGQLAFCKKAECAYSSARLEQAPYKDRVLGSNPSARILDLLRKPCFV